MFGTMAVMALTMLSESVVLKAEDEVVVMVAVVMADLRSLTAAMSGRAWRKDPVKEATSLVRLEMSELMVERSDRTVLAWRLLRGAADARELSRSGRRAAVSCILELGQVGNEQYA